MTPRTQNLLDKGLEESGLSLEDLDNIVVSEQEESVSLEDLDNIDDISSMLTEEEDRKEMAREISQSIVEEILTEVVSRPTKKQASLSKYPKLTMSAYFSFLEQ